MRIFNPRKQVRLKSYDYSLNGYYFVTICTQNRECLFGEITNGVGVGFPDPKYQIGVDPKPYMKLNNIGQIINKWWLKIPNKFNHILLDIYQIMPNHIHGIIVIKNYKCVGAGFPRPNVTNPTLGQIIGYLKYQTTKHINNHVFDNDDGNNVDVGNGVGNCVDNCVGNDVGVGFPDPNINKGGETPPLQRITLKKIWQRNYYEHIIRNQIELEKIREYIRLNPTLWNKDVNNPKNLKKPY